MKGDSLEALEIHDDVGVMSDGEDKVTWFQKGRWRD